MPTVPDPCTRKSAWYYGLHAALEDLYGETTRNLADKDRKTNLKVAFKTFLKAAESVFKSKGYNPEMLSEPEASGLIRETYRVFQNAIDTAIADNDVPEEMARKLDHDAFMFSGFKVHHELSEVGLSLRDKETGKVKAYETFANDVRKIHQDYNETYLRSEYLFAVTSSQMAARWADVEQGKGRYDLQYRTAGDDRVREDHAAMNGITLPSDDPFWREYYPPNGWRCRCTTVEVNKGKYPVSDSKEAQRIGQRSTTQLDRFGNNKAAIFRFNPGMEEKVFPPKHPYLPKGCEGCTRKPQNLAYSPNNPLCQACQVISSCADKELVKTKPEKWIEDTIKKTAEGKICKRAIPVIDTPEEISTFCKEKGIELAPGGLQVTDEKIMHALRHDKINRGQAISTEQMINIGENLKKAEIYYDSTEKHQNFVFIYEDESGVIKYVFKMNYKVKTDGKKQNLNIFTTAGKISRINIKDANYVKIK